MSWHYLPELAGVSSERTSLGGRRSARSRSTRTAERCFCDASETACFPCSQSGTTPPPSTGAHGVDLWMSSLAASRASLTRSSGSAPARTTSETSGPTPSASSVRWDRDACIWRTSQGSLFSSTLEPFSETWWRAGSASDGIASPRPPLEPRIDETASGLWATPSARDWKDTPGMAVTGTDPDGTERGRLDQLARQVYDAERRAGRKIQGMALNPSWVEWLMGWPIGWTELRPSATARFQQWSRTHGGS